MGSISDSTVLPLVIAVTFNNDVYRLSPYAVGRPEMGCLHTFSFVRIKFMRIFRLRSAEI